MNKKLYIALVAVIVLVAVALIVTSTDNAGNQKLAAQIGQRVPQSVLSQMNIPNSVSNKIGIGSVSYFPQVVSPAKPMTNGTKPMIVYLGAEYCPYCAITRWGLIIALMKFGTFSNLHYMASSSTDVFPNTPTFSFYNATYSSNYISFIAVETQTRNKTALQIPTAFENNLFTVYNLDNTALPPNQRGGIPFIDFANQSLTLEAPELPQILQGQTWNTVLANLTATNSSDSQALVGSADLFTAQICMITNNTPSDVCNQPYVANIQHAYLG